MSGKTQVNADAKLNIVAAGEQHFRDVVLNGGAIGADPFFAGDRSCVIGGLLEGAGDLTDFERVIMADTAEVAPNGNLFFPQLLLSGSSVLRIPTNSQVFAEKLEALSGIVSMEGGSLTATSGVSLAGGTMQGGGVVSGEVQMSGGELRVTGTLTVNGKVTANGSKLNLQSGTLIASGGLQLQNGAVLQGNGAINGNAVIDGILSPGASPGTIIVNGDVTVNAGGAIVLQVGGTASDQHDKLIVNGNLQRAGKLVLSFTNGFAPKAGDRFDLLTVSGADTGAFAVQQIKGLAPGFDYELSVNSGTVTMTALNDAQPDRTAPVVKIVSPSARKVSGPFTISGTVKELAALDSVIVRLNGVELPLDAALSADAGAAISWSVSNAMPENGPNIIEIEAIDGGGNRGTASKTVNSTFGAAGALAGNYAAVLSPVATPGVDTTGLISITVTTTGAFSGKAMIGGLKIPLRGVLRNNGDARFMPALGSSVMLERRKPIASLLGVLALSVSDSDGLTGTLSEDATGAVVLADFAGKVAPYSRKNPAPVEFLNQPAGNPTKGYYTLVFPSKPQQPEIDPFFFPQGDGFSTVTVKRSGSVSLAGQLADGTRFSAGGQLRADGSLPLFAQLYRKRGGLAGELAFANLSDSDWSGTDLLWVRPEIETQKSYPDGWPLGIRVDAVGTKYAKPASLDFGQGATNAANGNALLTFTDGWLNAALVHPVNVDSATGAAKTVPPRNALCKVALDAAKGLLKGTFTHPDNGKAKYSGILLNKGANKGGFGYFLSLPPPVFDAEGQGGGVSLNPRGP